MDTMLETSSRGRRTLDPKPATPILFAHFVLRSSNIQPMIDWYSTVLNMHVVQRTDYICFLTYDNEHHRLGIVNLAGLVAPDAKTAGLAHVAYTMADIGALLSRSRRQWRRTTGRPLRNQGSDGSLLPDGRVQEESDRRRFRSGGAGSGLRSRRTRKRAAHHARGAAGGTAIAAQAKLSPA